MATWYQKSLAFINKEAADNPNMTQVELKKHCSKNYPFEQRRGHACVAWLKAVKDYFSGNKSSANMDLLEDK